MSRALRLIVLWLVMTCALPVFGQYEQLTVGGSAQVYVEDEGLKLRSGPGVSNNLIETMPSGTIVEIIGGPKSDGTYVWWNVRAPSGNEGWSVDAANGIQTLIAMTIIEQVGAEHISTAMIDEMAAAIYEMIWSPDDHAVMVNMIDQIALIEVASGNIISVRHIIDFPVEADFLFPVIHWSSDSRYVHITQNADMLIDPGIVPGFIIDGATGEIIGNLDAEAIEWAESSVMTVNNFIGIDTDQDDPDTFGCPPACTPEPVMGFIEGTLGTLQTGNPAMFTTLDGVVTALGDGRGGAGWRNDSSLVVIWGDIVYTGTSAAEVWDVATGEMLARVPHNSLNGWAGPALPAPAFLSNDETRLAAVVSSGLQHTITFYRIGLPE